MNRQNPVLARRAFTLVELLVVIAIIGVVIALVLPALGGARQAARKSGTDGELKTITNAVSSYVNDEHHLPGVFTAAQMGNAENIGRGMSEAENVLLDLIGYQSLATGGMQVGPTSTNTINLDPALIGVPGSGSKQYFSPDKKLYVAQLAGSQQVAAVPGHAGADGAPQLADLVDYWGDPILFWRQDETYITKPGAPTFNFASGDSSTRAKFYWASNSCFLTAPALGKKGLDQTDSTKGSFISAAPVPATNSLAGALGNPNDPYRPAGTPLDIKVARSARAPFIAQSAGADGYYFGRKDRGASQFPPQPVVFINYAVNFYPDPSNTAVVHTDTNGKPTNHDILSQFDDLISTAGN